MNLYIILLIASLVFNVSGTHESLNVIDDDMDNEIRVNDNINDKLDPSPFLDAANSFLKENAEGNVGNIGNMLSNFIQQDGGKAVESLLMGAAQNPDVTGQIISGIGSMLSQKNGGAALDPSVIGNVLSMMSNAAGPEGGGHQNKQSPMISTVTNLFSNFISEFQKNKDNDIGSIFSLFSNLLQDQGENPLSLFIDSLSSFLGPEALEREHNHASHAFLLPPLVEKAHLYFDHFKHTELYNAIWRVTGANKIFNMFAVDGKFNFDKFFVRLENRSFRRHWINLVTKKITDFIAVITDPQRHKSYASTIISLFNGFLRSMDFPKSTLFDSSKPTETLTNLVQYFSTKYLNAQVDARYYVKPAVIYVQDVIRLAQKKGFLFKDGINSKELAHKLTDTINLEIIEPVAIVWRAYRFAKKVPQCDKYVLCVINQETDDNEILSLPGLKPAIIKTASIISSWFLSEHTKTSFWMLYTTINDEHDCQVRYTEACNQFHLEEKLVHAEYDHTEL